jgi:hypothetical protein
MIKQEATVSIIVRLPKDLLAWVEKEAARSLASRNSEIVRSLRARMDSEQREKATG